MAPALRGGKHSSADGLGAARTRAGSKWLESIQAELNEIDSVLGKNAKNGTLRGSQPTREISGPAASIPSPIPLRRNTKRSTSPKARGRGKSDTPAKPLDAVSRSASPKQSTRSSPHLHTRSIPPDTKSLRPKQPGEDTGSLIRQALAISAGAPGAPSKSPPKMKPKGIVRGDHLGKHEDISNMQVAIAETRLSESEKALKELVGVRKQYTSMFKNLRSSSLKPSGRYPRSLSPEREGRLRWHGVRESSTHRLGANWGSLTEAQRPEPTLQDVTQSKVPFYGIEDAWNCTQECSASSVWSREQTLRTGPLQWRESSINGIAWRLDGRKPSSRSRSASCRSQSRSKSPDSHNELLVHGIGTGMPVVNLKKWRHFEGGRFNRSPRQTSDWIYKGVDRQLSLLQESEGRLLARRIESQLVGSPCDPMQMEMIMDPPAGLQTLPPSNAELR